MSDYENYEDYDNHEIDRHDWRDKSNSPKKAEQRYNESVGYDYTHGKRKGAWKSNRPVKTGSHCPAPVPPPPASVQATLSVSPQVSPPSTAPATPPGKVKKIFPWVGSKQRLLPTLREYYPKNFNNYFEPCCGSASVFIDLYNRGFRGHAILTDLNPLLITTLRTIQTSPARVVEEFRDHVARHGEDYYLRIRAQPHSLLTDEENAARFLYIVKSSFNGMWRENNHGGCNSPWGKHKKVALDSDATHTFSHALQGTELLQGDFGNVLNAKANDFVYLDPPYDQTFSDYSAVRFGQEDHQRLHHICSQLNKRNALFMQSNSDTPFIRHLYRDFQIVEVKAQQLIASNSAKRKTKNELLIMNY